MYLLAAYTERYARQNFSAYICTMSDAKYNMTHDLFGVEEKSLPILGIAIECDGSYTRSRLCTCGQLILKDMLDRTSRHIYVPVGC